MNSAVDDNFLDELLKNLDRSDDESIFDVDVTFPKPGPLAMTLPSTELNPSQLSSRFDKSSRKRSRDDSTSSDSDVIEIQTTQLRVKHCTFNKTLNLPKIVKTDLRRKFGLMFTNVFNSMDFILLDSFFRKFFIPSAALIKDDSSLAGCSVNLQSTELLIAYFGLILQLSPDGMFRLGEMKIRKHLDSPGSELVANFHLQLTKFYDAAPGKVANFVVRKFKESQQRLAGGTTFDEGMKRGNKRAKKFDVSDYSSYLTMKREIEEDRDYLDILSQFNPLSPKFNSWAEFPALESPVSLNLDGVITFKINDQKRIESLSMMTHLAKV